MLVEDVHKVVKFLSGMVPDTPDVIQVSEKDLWLEWAFRKSLFFPVRHIDVCIGWGESFSHGCSFDLEKPIVVKKEIIFF